MKGTVQVVPVLYRTATSAIEGAHKTMSCAPSFARDWRATDSPRAVVDGRTDIGMFDGSDVGLKFWTDLSLD